MDELLRDVDDRLVIMGSGDEVTLQFDSRDPGSPARGMDARLSAQGRRLGQGSRSQHRVFSSVLPLPFHAMSRYPYPATEHYPRDAAHDDYQRTYNMRPATALLKPMESH